MLPKNLRIKTRKASRYVSGNVTEYNGAKGSTHHNVLYSDVAGARCVGYAISVTSTGAADAANVSPNPIKNLCHARASVVHDRDQAAIPWTYRAPMNIPTELEAVWRTVAMHMITAPKTTAVRRPRPSDMYGEKGYAARHPMFCEYVCQNRHVRSESSYMRHTPGWHSRDRAIGNVSMCQGVFGVF